MDLRKQADLKHPDATMTAESNKEALVQARKQLNQLIETEIELGIMVHDFQATIEAKGTLISRM
jgi:hypothetical protein